MAVVKTAALVSVTSLLVSGTDQVADSFDGSILGQLTTPTRIAEAIAATGLIGIIFALVLVLAVLALWAELAVRASVIYLVVMAAPMILAASIHPKLRGSWTKLAELGAAVIFSKILVALAISIAFAELSGISASPSFAEGIGALVAGIATLGIACFAPFVLFRLFALEVAHLEGLSRRPVRAARDAQQLAYYHRGSSFGSFLNRHGSEPGTAGGAGGPGLPPGGGPLPGRAPSGGGGMTGAGGAAVPAGALLIAGQRLASVGKEAARGGVEAVAGGAHARSQTSGTGTSRARDGAAERAGGFRDSAAVAEGGSARREPPCASSAVRLSEEATSARKGSEPQVGLASPPRRLDENASPAAGASAGSERRATSPATAAGSVPGVVTKRKEAITSDAKRPPERLAVGTDAASGQAGKHPPAHRAGSSPDGDQGRPRTEASAPQPRSRPALPSQGLAGRATQQVLPTSNALLERDAASPAGSVSPAGPTGRPLPLGPQAGGARGGSPSNKPKPERTAPPAGVVRTAAATEEMNERGWSESNGVDHG
jgi:hypothetical protein